MFKKTMRSVFMWLIGIFALLGVESMAIDMYTVWYNWKYANYNIKAVPMPFINFKYIAKPGYHIEAVCVRKDGSSSRYPKVNHFDYFYLTVQDEKIDKQGCDVLVMQNLDIVAPLKDYDIKPAQPQ